MSLMKVDCLWCGKAMVNQGEKARTHHKYDSGIVLTVLWLFRCETPDCGNEVVVEGS